MKLPEASEKELLATEMDACVSPLLAGEKTAVYEEPEPENSEMEPLETEISAAVKSEDSSERVKEMRAVLPTSTEEELEEMEMVGGAMSLSLGNTSSEPVIFKRLPPFDMLLRLLS